MSYMDDKAVAWDPAWGTWGSVDLPAVSDIKKCECGVDSLGMGEAARHSDYCPKYKPAPTVDFEDPWRQNK